MAISRTASIDFLARQQQREQEAEEARRALRAAGRSATAGWAGHPVVRVPPPPPSVVPTARAVRYDRTADALDELPGDPAEAATLYGWWSARSRCSACTPRCSTCTPRTPPIRRWTR